MKFLTIPTEGAPTTRSPMERATRAMGAQLQPRRGAMIATAYPSGPDERGRLAEAVGHADASHLGVLELQAPPSAPAALADAVSTTVPGVELEPGRAVRVADAWWCGLGPGRALVIGETAALGAMRASLDVPPVRATDLTAGHAAIIVAGPLARETVARFCALDLRPTRAPVHACRAGSIARTPGLVIREALDRYLLLFGAAYGAYLWTVVADAAEHLGGGPVGVDALEAVPAHA